MPRRSSLGIAMPYLEAKCKGEGDPEGRSSLRSSFSKLNSYSRERVLEMDIEVPSGGPPIRRCSESP